MEKNMTKILENKKLKGQAKNKNNCLFSLSNFVIASAVCEAIQKYLWIAAPHKQHGARNDRHRTSSYE